MRIERFAVVVILVMCLSACVATPSGGGDQGGDGSNNSKLENGSGVVAEYQDTVKSFPLPLPHGFHFPTKPPAELLKGESGVGVGVGPAYFYWLCAWEASYLKADSSGDSTTASEALGHLKSWPDTSFAKKYITDPDGGWYKAVVTPATLGDPSGIRNDMAGNGCAALGVESP